MRSTARRTLMILVLTALAGCGPARLGMTRVQRLEGDPGTVVLTGLTVPEVRGTPGSGAQALAAVMAYYDRELDAGDIAEALPWHDLVATPDELADAARRNGYHVERGSGTWSALEVLVRAGTPAIVLMTEPDESGGVDERAVPRSGLGWNVVVGMRHDDGALILGRRRGRAVVLSRTVFLDRWNAGGDQLIVLQPSWMQLKGE